MTLNPPVPRARSLDFMRGLAILLILPVNILSFTVGGYAAFWPIFDSDVTTADHAAFFLTSFLIQGKVYPLLALMFGAGAWFALNKLREQGRSVLPWVYRLLLLCMFGVLHTLLLFEGDILIDYSIAALLILLVWKLPTRVCIWIAIVFLAIPLFSNLARYHLYYNLDWDDYSAYWDDYENWDGEDSWLEEDSENLGWLEGEEAEAHMDTQMKEQGRMDIWIHRLEGRIAYRFQDVAYFLTTFLWQIAGWMIIGYLLARANVWSGDFRLSRRMRRLLPWAIAVALTLQLLNTLNRMIPLPGGGIVHLVVDQVGQALMVLVYLALFFLLFPAVSKVTGLVGIVAGAGRMTLSFYIMYSVVLVILFEPYAIGLSAGYTVSIFLLVPAIWAVFLFAGWLWLKRFDHGPLESVMVRLGAKTRRRVDEP